MHDLLQYTTTKSTKSLHLYYIHDNKNDTGGYYGYIPIPYRYHFAAHTYIFATPCDLVTSDPSLSKVLQMQSPHQIVIALNCRAYLKCINHHSCNIYFICVIFIDRYNANYFKIDVHIHRLQVVYQDKSEAK